VGLDLIDENERVVVMEHWGGFGMGLDLMECKGAETRDEEAQKQAAEAAAEKQQLKRT
jgi:hypothetical protein